MNGKQSIELAPDCIKGMTHWGSTTYHNICEGTSTTAQWGFMDYVLAVGVTMFCMAIVVGLLVGIYRLAVDY